MYRNRVIIPDVQDDVSILISCNQNAVKSGVFQLNSFRKSTVSVLSPTIEKRVCPLSLLYSKVKWF